MKLKATQFGALRQSGSIINALVDLNTARNLDMTDAEFDIVLRGVIKSLRLLKNNADGFAAWDALDEASSILNQYLG
jgi:hypothetical protein